MTNRKEKERNMKKTKEIECKDEKKAKEEE